MNNAILCCPGHSRKSGTGKVQPFHSSVSRLGLESEYVHIPIVLLFEGQIKMQAYRRQCTKREQGLHASRCHLTP